MSVYLGKLCSVILLEHFGEIVQTVGYDLFKWGSKPLQLLVNSTGLKFQQVRRALRVLIQYGLVTFSEGTLPKKAEYTLVAERVLLLLRYPKYILLMKTRYGVEAEILVEEILRRGQDTASAVILRASERLKNATEAAGEVSLVTIRDKFATLATKQFVMRCPSAVEKKDVPTLTVKERELFLLPEISIKALSELQKGVQNVDPGDKGIHWRVNLDRFHQDFRDDIMISAMTRRFDENVGELMRVILQQMYLRTEPWASVSNPVPFSELKDTIRKSNSHATLAHFLEQYLSVMEEDSSCFVSKVGDSAGGQYCVNIKNAFMELTWTTVENVVLERFGSKAARIFRLIRAKKFVEQEQIQQVAMIPAKEAKLLTYKLLEENFIQIKELRKSLAVHGPNKTFFLFYIKIDQVARMLLEICFKALYNALTRRDHDHKENCRLVEKHQRIESITLSMRTQGIAAEQIAEIEEMITPPELALLEKVKSMIKRLSEAEMQLDETVFMLQLFLNYHN